MFCPTWGYLGLYVGKLQGFETDVLFNLRLLGTVCWQPTGFWDRYLSNVGLLGTVSWQPTGFWEGSLSNLGVLGTVCWQFTGLWDGSVFNLGPLGLYVGNLGTDVCPTWDYLGLYVGNPRGFEMDVLSNLGLLGTVCWQPPGLWTDVCPTWGYLGLYINNLRSFETDVLSTSSYWGGMLVTVRRKFIQLGASWGGTVCWQTWDGCLSNLGHLGLYVGNDGALRWMFVQFGATWECMLATYRALRRMFCPTWGYLGLYVGNLQGFETDVLCNLRLLRAVCWQPTGLWDRCLFNLWLLGLYVGNLHGFDMDVCPTWGYLGLYVGNLHCFDMDVCPTWGYLGLSVGKLQGFETKLCSSSSWKFVQVGATWNCMLANYRAWSWCLSNLGVLGTVCW